MPVFLDTNVLVYSVSEAAEDAVKREIAQQLLDRVDIRLSMQVLQEFFVQTTRPSRQYRMSERSAIEYIASWRRFPVQETTLDLLDRGLSIHERHRFSFWDAMIVAAARAQDCTLLYTEDMQDGRIVEGMRIVDPFRRGGEAS